MLLGDIVAKFEDEAEAAEAVLNLGDLGLLATLQRQADAAGVPLGTYAAWSVRAYADHAPPDEWTTLLGIIGRAEDPAAAYLRRAFAYVLGPAPVAAGRTRSSASSFF